MWSDRRKSVAAGVREPERMNHNLGAGGLAHMHNKQAYQEEQYQKRLAQERHRVELERQMEEVRQRREADRVRKRLEDEEWERKNNPNYQQQHHQAPYQAPRAPPPKSGVEAPMRTFAQVYQPQQYQPAAAPAYSTGISFQKQAPMSYSPRGLDLGGAASRIRPTRIEPFQIKANPPLVTNYSAGGGAIDTQLSSMFQGDSLDRLLQNNRAQHTTDQTLQATAEKVNQGNSNPALLQYSGYETAVNTSTILPDMKQNRGLVMADLKSASKRDVQQQQSHETRFKIDALFGKKPDADDVSERSVFDVPPMGGGQKDAPSEKRERVLPAEAFQGISFPDLLREAPREHTDNPTRETEELHYSSELIPPQKPTRPPTAASMYSATEKSFKGTMRPVSCLSQVPSLTATNAMPSPSAAESTTPLDEICTINITGTVFELCTEDEIRRGGLELTITITSDSNSDGGAVLVEGTVDMLIHLMTGSLGGGSLSFNTLKNKIMPRQSWVFASDKRSVTCRLQPSPAFRISVDEIVTITFPFSSIPCRCEMSKSAPSSFTIRTLDTGGCL